ncbi:MAG TPA: ferredoxin [Mycobacterium sp.]|nr:ferredoxin [Mycobacterium sp.]
MAADAVFDQYGDSVLVLLADKVPDGEEEHAREAVKLSTASALREASAGRPE